jgi:hypothetical protein
MVLPQIALDKIKPQNDSVPLLIQGSPQVDLSEAGIEDSVVLLFRRVLEQVNLERMRSEKYEMAANLELLISEAPIHESTTTLIDFEAPLTTEEGTLAREVLQRIVITFDKAKELLFEDGIESDFSRELVSLIKSYGDIAMRVLANLILNEEVNAEIASEVLRWLGQMEDPKTYSHRLGLLEQSLYCSSARVRDGAALGLAFLDDPHAVPDLREAIQREPYPELREDMEQVLEQLENSHRCRSF